MMKKNYITKILVISILSGFISQKVLAAALMNNSLLDRAIGRRDVGNAIVDNDNDDAWNDAEADERAMAAFRMEDERKRIRDEEVKRLANEDRAMRAAAFINAVAPAAPVDAAAPAAPVNMAELMIRRRNAMGEEPAHVQIPHAVKNPQVINQGDFAQRHAILARMFAGQLANPLEPLINPIVRQGDFAERREMLERMFAERADVVPAAAPIAGNDIPLLPEEDFIALADLPPPPVAMLADLPLPLVLNLADDLPAIPQIDLGDLPPPPPYGVNVPAAIDPRLPRPLPPIPARAPDPVAAAAPAVLAEGIEVLAGGELEALFAEAPVAGLPLLPADAEIIPLPIAPDPVAAAAPAALIEEIEVLAGGELEALFAEAPVAGLPLLPADAEIIPLPIAPDPVAAAAPAALIEEIEVLAGGELEALFAEAPAAPPIDDHDAYIEHADPIAPAVDAPAPLADVVPEPKLTFKEKKMLVKRILDPKQLDISAPVKTQTEIVSTQSATNLESVKVESVKDDVKQKLISQISTPVEIDKSLENISNNILSHIHSRLISITAPAAIGMAAGDEEGSKISNVWAKGIFGVTTQSQNGTASGYRGKLFGCVIGLEGEINDNFILGTAYSNILSRFNYKNERDNDKTIIRSHVLSLYSHIAINDKLTWDNIASILLSKINTKDHRDSEVINGKYKNNGLSFNTSLGYKITQDNIVFIPNIGLKYNAFRDNSYTETGGVKNNLLVESRSNQSLAGILGVNVQALYTIFDGISITPILHGSVEYQLLDKKQKVRAKIIGTDHYIDNSLATNAKAPTYTYNVGGGVNITKNNIEVAFDYNCTLMKKYRSHQGSVKLKVMF